MASKRFQRSGETTRNRKSKKEKKEKEGFYASHKAEKQRSGNFSVSHTTVSTQLTPTSIELMELKRKWEEDKAKVEKLKASRRFKPY